MMANKRGGTKCTLQCLRADSLERVRNHRNKQIDKPEVEDKNADDEKDARHEELCVDHLIHSS
jgi:hypothetical protein